ncbi:unnamed protein product, partial [marine sediment metagenome]
NYLPEELIAILNEPELIEEKADKFQEELNDIYERLERKERESFFSPSSYFITWQEVCNNLKSKKMINFTYFSKRKIKKKENTREFVLEGQEIGSYFGNLDLFTRDLKKWRQERQNIIILTGNEGRANRLGEIFEERGIKKFTLGKMEEYSNLESIIYISYGYLNYGFRLPLIRTILITDQEIFGKQRNRRYKLPRHKNEPLFTMIDITQGDYVVHIDHGVGIYKGIINLTVKGVKQDYLLIEYAGG